MRDRRVADGFGRDDPAEGRVPEPRTRGHAEERYSPRAGRSHIASHGARRSAAQRASSSVSPPPISLSSITAAPISAARDSTSSSRPGGSSHPRIRKRARSSSAADPLEVREKERDSRREGEVSDSPWRVNARPLSREYPAISAVPTGVGRVRAPRPARRRRHPVRADRR